jgi:hypothetical protein
MLFDEILFLSFFLFLIPRKDFELDSSPTDTPARVKFHNTSNRLVVASWDFVRLLAASHLVC